ncbi:MAG: hypothetical protein R3F41_17740 [Gammaproteobacteria bacterium]|nr:hypothetical protein [Pseudomonadales bacterium]MCP5347391.1 hypothetical protein [Pseudomonadales bacterium]
MKVSADFILRPLSVVLLSLAAFLSVSAYPQSREGFVTPWGDPDLQGTWSYASLTPLQRPLELGDKEFYTEQEAARINQRSRQEQVDAPGDTGNYNVGWFDQGNVSADLRTSLIVYPPDGRLPLTDAARQLLAERAAYRRDHPADSYTDRTPWDRCITYHGVPPVSTGYNNTYLIVQNPDYVAIYVENIHDVRIIPLDGRPPLDPGIRQWNGDSRGHWEGNTLVVTTTNYSEKTELRFPSSESMQAVERFTRVADDRIDYQFTVEDPATYSRPWTAVRPMPALDDYTIFEYACHEGNYAMYNILRGARVQEAAEAAADSP